MGQGELSSQTVILIVILGTAFTTACGYGMYRALATRQKNNEFDREFNERNVEQDQYMAELRMAYRNGIMADARSYRPGPGLGPVSGPGHRYSQESSVFDKGSGLDSRQEQHGY